MQLVSGQKVGENRDFMHARSCQTNHRSDQTARAGFTFTTPPLKSSPSTTRFSTILTTPPPTRSRSCLFEPIHEESTAAEDSDPHKRQHRHRPPIQRTNSAPLLISTITTSPIHIHHLRYFTTNFSRAFPSFSSLFSSRYYFPPNVQSNVAQARR